MKKHAFQLAISLLCTVPTIVSANQAIYILLSNPNGTALQQTDIKAIQQTIGNGINNGIIGNFITYNHDAIQLEQFAACAEANETIQPEQFNSLVNQLHALSPQTNINYTLRYIKSCPRDNTLVCLDKSVSCLSSELITEALYTDYQAKIQFANALADISVGTAPLSMMLAQGRVSTPTIAELGLQESTQHCSSIAVSGFDAVTGDAAITCVIQGNSAVLGKFITWTRTNDGVWACTTDVTDIKYTAGKCG